MKSTNVPALKISLLAVLLLVPALLALLYLPAPKPGRAHLASTATPLVRHSPTPVVRHVWPARH